MDRVDLNHPRRHNFCGDYPDDPIEQAQVCSDWSRSGPVANLVRGGSTVGDIQVEELVRAQDGPP